MGLIEELKNQITELFEDKQQRPNTTSTWKVFTREEKKNDESNKLG
jgi:hypothetical protein